ncbi:MAG: hypothetical protein CL792_06505 [Chloroflexi bacterium]|mgnify:CR=1 FL=1|nr:hypothetical protein [Chloroflexota bacterium]|tara:strand:- start:873 stop:1466 length:594 start_codon:yes stop_codon:yes gene_type:complete
MDYVRLREYMSGEVPAKMLAHIDRVVKLAGFFGEKYGLNVSEIKLAAQGHDLFRALPQKELLQKAKDMDLDIHPVELNSPVLLHGPLAAIELKERFNIKNPQVLETIKWHTTGHPEFSLESWAMFIADKVEPNKIAKNSDLQIVSDIAGESLEKAALTYIDIRINEALQLGLQIHPMSIHTRNTLLSKFDAISNSGG